MTRSEIKPATFQIQLHAVDKYYFLVSFTTLIKVIWPLCNEQQKHGSVPHKFLVLSHRTFMW